MTSPAAHSRMVLSLYRGLFRAARSLDALLPPGAAVAAVLSTTDLPAGMPSTVMTASSVTAPMRLTKVLRHQFTAHCRYPMGADTDEVVNIGFRSLRTVSSGDRDR